MSTAITQPLEIQLKSFFLLPNLCSINCFIHLILLSNIQTSLYIVFLLLLFSQMGKIHRIRLYLKIFSFLQAYLNEDSQKIELELYPINLSFYKHTSFPSKHHSSKQGDSMGVSFQSVVQYLMNLSGTSSHPTGQPQNLNAPGVINPIYRQHSYYGAFSRLVVIVV